METTTNNNHEEAKGLTYSDIMKVLKDNDKYQEEFVKALGVLGVKFIIQEYVKDPIMLLPKRFEPTIAKLKIETT